MVDLLFNVVPVFVGILFLSLLCDSFLCVHSSFAIILRRKGKLVTLLLVPCGSIVTLNLLWFFLTVSWLVCSM